MDEKAKSIQIYCDGVELPMAPFVATLFYNTLEAMAGSLKGAESAKTVTITLTKPSAED
jgi:hypothetical protein